MSAITVMTALETVLPAGTRIATTLIYKGTGVEVATFPALIISAMPPSTRTREANHSKQWHHRILCLYLDRWETTARTYEQIMADADQTLDAMVTNLEANPDLIIGGTQYATAGGDHIEKYLDGPLPRAEDELSFPMIAGRLIVTIPDMWEVVFP